MPNSLHIICIYKINSSSPRISTPVIFRHPSKNDGIT
jgi:hypothetical protein